MMDPNKIDRPVATVSRNAWYLRFYLWLWAADVDKVDFCRLFWGYVFAVPWLLIRTFILMPIFWVIEGCIWIKKVGIWKAIDGIEWAADRTVFPVIGGIYRFVTNLIPERKQKEKPKRRRREPWRSPVLSPVTGYTERKPSKIATFFKSLRTNGGEMFLGGVGKTADKSVELAQRTWPYTRWLFIAVGAVVGLVIAFACGYLIWVFISVVPVVSHAIWIALSAAAEGIGWFFATIFASRWIWLAPLLLVGLIGLTIICTAIANSRPMQRAGSKTKQKTLGFGGAMKMGVKSVKYRTCPVIKVEE